jgi:hypothetical protein
LLLQRNVLTHLKYWVSSKTRKPLVLRGARQVGKSTAVRLFAAAQGLTLYEVNLERHPHLDAIFASLDMEVIRSNLESVLKTSIDDKGGLLFLDEVQATPRALAALRYFYEDWPSLPVIAAGSLLEFELADHSYSMPVGRIQYGFMQPLTFAEFLTAKGEDWLLQQIESYQLGQPWPAATHAQAMRLVHTYTILGGMPEVVAYHAENPRGQEWGALQDNVIATYRDDFAKYGKKTQLPLLQRVYDSLPRDIGHKIKASVLAPDHRAAQVRACIELLRKARLVRLAFHSHGDGVPLAAQLDEKVFKAYWLDIGLLNRMAGLRQSLTTLDESLFFKGKLAEQFIAQHLVELGTASDQQTLFYWLREGKLGNAEVDFLIQSGSHVVPIEVKSGKSGSMKSLLQFVAARSSPRAIKFSLGPPLVEQARHDVVTPAGVAPVTFTCHHLPLYFAGELGRLLEQPT